MVVQAALILPTNTARRGKGACLVQLGPALHNSSEILALWDVDPFVGGEGVLMGKTKGM